MRRKWNGVRGCVLATYIYVISSSTSSYTGQTRTVRVCQSFRTTKPQSYTISCAMLVHSLRWSRPRPHVEQAKDKQQRIAVPFLVMACRTLIVVFFMTFWTSLNLSDAETLGSAPTHPLNPNSVGWLYLSMNGTSQPLNRSGRIG